MGGPILAPTSPALARRCHRAQDECRVSPLFRGVQGEPPAPPPPTLGSLPAPSQGCPSRTPPRSLAGRASPAAVSVYGFQGRGIFLQRESPLEWKNHGGGRRGGRRGGTHSPREHPGPSPTAPQPGRTPASAPGASLTPGDVELGIGETTPSSRNKALAPQLGGPPPTLEAGDNDEAALTSDL